MKLTAADVVTLVETFDLLEDLALAVHDRGDAGGYERVHTASLALLKIVVRAAKQACEE